VLRFWKKSDVAAKDQPVVALPPSGRRPLIAGNWKMNYTHLEAIGLTQKLAFSMTPEQFAATEVVILPPFISIRSVQTLIDGDSVPLRYGAQDLSPHDSGAYTGDVSGSMLAKLGCSYVVVGHSERRQYHHEDDATVNAKLVAAFRNGLTPILCVGESLLVRDANGHLAHCSQQVETALSGLSAEQVQSLVIAYEPIWAIGTGKMATPENAQEVCATIRAHVGQLYSADVANSVRMLYGGSVKPSNAAEMLAQTDIDGALVGGASLDPVDFTAICVAAGQPVAAR
jgi:triosephosphate isomerase